MHPSARNSMNQHIKYQDIYFVFKAENYERFKEDLIGILFLSLSFWGCSLDIFIMKELRLNGNNFCDLFFRT